MVCGGGAWGRGSALLTADGKHVLVAVASHIRLYSSVSGEFVTSLSEHAADVTAVVLDHASNDKIYSASLDGTVKHWDYTSGQMLQSFKVNNPVQSMVIPAGGEMAYLQCDWVLEKAGKMLFLDLAEGGLAPYSLRLYQPSKYVVSPSGLFVATFFMKTVFIYSTKRPALPPLKLYHTREITCVAIDPTEERVAAGDNTGRILIWTGFKDKVPTLHRATPAATAVPTTSATAAAKKAAHNSDSGSDSDGSEDAQQDSAGGERQQPVAQPGSSKTNTSGEAAAVTGSVVPSRKSRQEHFSRLQRSRASVPVTTVHWHAHPVGALCFSADGTLLLSGGEEAVLVVWQLDSSHRTFLPRLGGPLTCITRSAVDAGCYVISQADNTVRMVNTASMKVEVSILGMRPPPRTVSALQSTSTAVLAPGGGELVLPTDNSMLQFWDAARDRHVNRLQVAPRNTVSLTQQDHALQGGMYGMPLEPHVSHVAFSSDGLVMATVDVRPNAGSLGSDEQSLRFWDRSEGGVTLGSSQEQPMYTMNTFLDDPHRGGVITSLAYHPSRNLAASTGSSGDIKMWVQQAERSKGRAAHWRCQSVGYHTAGAMSAAAFSGDGSLLAAASQDQVTLWDPDSNAMVSCLASPPANLGSPLRKLCFVPHSAYLVGYTTGANPSLIVWNLLTQSIWWSYQLAVSAMAADPKSGSIAVAMLPGDAQVGKSSQRTSAASGQAEGGAISQAKASSSVSKILRQGAMTVTRPDDDQSATASAVFLFCAATGQPRLSWSLGQSTAAALLFALPGTHLQSSAAAATPDGLSPLMIVLQDRQYTFAKSASSMQGASVQAVSLEQGQEPSAFEAAFGRPAVPQPAQQGAGVAHFQSDIQGRLQTLFDAPSHVLPALKDLAPMFFNSFTEHSSKLV